MRLDLGVCDAEKVIGKQSSCLVFNVFMLI